MPENICEKIQELMNNPYHEKWETYSDEETDSDEISRALLDVDEKTSLHLVRIAPLGEIREHHHERPKVGIKIGSIELEGIEILYFWRGETFLWEEERSQKSFNINEQIKKLVYSKQPYGIRNLSKKEPLYLISQFFPKYTGNGEIVK